MKKGIRTVLVGVDFSKYSKTVVLQARAVARSLKVPLVLMHVFDDPFVGEGKYDEIKKELTDIYTHQINDKFGVHDGESVVVKCGTAFERIIETAKKLPQPLIVVGDRSNRNAVAKFFLGSTAERLALHSPYPVWVHRGPKTAVPRRILIPCDFSKRSKNTIDGAKRLGLETARIELYHVLQPPIPLLDYPSWQALNTTLLEANEQQLKRFKKMYSSLKVVATESSDVVGRIKKESKAFDLVAISPRHHDGLFSSFGSVTSKVVRDGQTSVLVIP